MKILQVSEINKTRTRRLRKKLRVQEFQELGFEISITVKLKSSQSIEQIFDEWIAFIEANGWAFGGGSLTNGSGELLIEGFVSHFKH